MPCFGCLLLNMVKAIYHMTKLIHIKMKIIKTTLIPLINISLQWIPIYILRFAHIWSTLIICCCVCSRFLFPSLTSFLWQKMAAEIGLRTRIEKNCWKSVNAKWHIAPICNTPTLSWHARLRKSCVQDGVKKLLCTEMPTLFFSSLSIDHSINLSYFGLPASGDEYLDNNNRENWARSASLPDLSTVDLFAVWVFWLTRTKRAPYVILLYKRVWIHFYFVS